MTLTTFIRVIFLESVYGIVGNHRMVPFFPNILHFIYICIYNVKKSVAHACHILVIVREQLTIMNVISVISVALKSVIIHKFMFRQFIIKLCI